jgi:PilZ domain
MSQSADKVEERRASSRYNLALPVEIRVVSTLTSVGSILVETRDISTHGFYFNIAQKFTSGTEFEFSIALPIEVTGTAQAYVCGKARAVRIEEIGGGHLGQLGVGALIESYQISRAESVTL